MLPSVQLRFFRRSPSMPNAPFHIMTKPTGALCNLDCQYCYYLEKEKLYPEGSSFRMPPEVLEAFVRDYMASQPTLDVQFAWQGGEPTLLGLDFFQEVVRLQKEHSNGKRIANAIQTNGTFLDDDWCSFFTENRFLVGLSIDGPAHLHDAYRVDKGGKPTFEKVMRGLDFLKKHETEFNTLTVVNRKNSERPLEVYEFLKDIGSTFMQFIPLVEREPDASARTLGLDLASPPPVQGSVKSDSGTEAASEGEDAAAEPSPVTPWSVEAKTFGSFLLGIFHEWAKADVGKVFVQLFDTTLAGWTGQVPPLCVFAETCGDALVLEHNGDLYSCDHYVYPDFKLGNVLDTPLVQLASDRRQVEFGEAKKDTLPNYCQRCDVRFLCNGECPKHRFIKTPDGEPGLNYLCAGYKAFFTQTTPHFKLMADLLRQRRAPAEIMTLIPEMESKEALARAGRNDPCPCGSGKKVKQCCGKEG
jgi:uncharacterized protein